MNKLTEEEFEILVGRLTDSDEDAPITVGSSDHKEFTKDVLEDFFNIQRKYSVIVKITQEQTYQTTAFNINEAEEKVYGRSCDHDKESGVYLSYEADSLEECIKVEEGWET